MPRLSVITKVTLALMVSMMCASCALLGPGKGQMPGLDRYLTDETVLYFEVADTAAFRQAWHNTPSGQAWQDPGVAYWHEQHLAPALRGLTGQMHLPNLLDALENAEGAVALAVMVPSSSESGPPQPQMALLMNFGGNALAARTQLGFEEGETIAAPPELKKHVDSITLHGAPWFDWQPCSTWIGDNWLFASNRQTLNAILNRRFGVGDQTDKARRFADSDLGGMMRRRTRGDGLSWGLDIAALHDTYLPEVLKNLRAMGLPDQAARLKALLNLMGVAGLDIATTSVEVADGKFHTTSIMRTRGETGVILPLQGKPALQTPAWFQNDTTEFSAMHLREPGRIYADLTQALRQSAPQMATLLDLLEGGIENRAGATPQTLLKAMGTEVAIAVPPQSSDGFIFAWSLSHPPLIKSALQTYAIQSNHIVTRTSYRGYAYDSWQSAGLPVRFQTAFLGDFFVLTTNEAWLRSFLDHQHTYAGEDEEAIETLRGEGLDKALEAQLGPLPAKARIAALGQSNPGKMLNELQGAIPMAFPIINLQLRMQGLPGIPGWVRECIPPLRPWAERVGPSIYRTTVRDNLFITESQGTFDPLASPLLAAVACAAHQVLKPDAEPQP